MTDGAWSPIEPPYDPEFDQREQSESEPPDYLDDPYRDVVLNDPAPAEPAKQKQGRAPTQSAELVEMAKALYRMAKSPEGKIYAVKHDQPGLALPLKGTAGGLRQQLSSLYYAQKKRTASSTALQEMMSVLEGDAMAAADEHVFLRFADDAATGTLYIDLGTPDGQTIAVTPTGWKLLPTSPVLFRRSALISPMPHPQQGGSLEGLRKLINIPESGFRLLIGWLVASCIHDIPHPILGIIGQQGTAKTSAMKLLIQLISPSPATSNIPDKVDDWATTAYNAPIIGLDNVSTLKPWFQDALCKAVTGDGYIKRENYSDSDITVLHFKRPIVITSIDPGSLQGDVSDRLLRVDLDPIPENGRRTEKEVKNEFDSIRRSSHGAILDLLAGVIGILPNVKLEEMPRMADFARVLAALDQVTGWTTLEDYLKTTTEAAVDVIEGNLFAAAIRDLIEDCGVWTGTTTELLEKVSPHPRPQIWPKTPGAAGGALKRNIPPLKSIGISVMSHRTSTSRRYTISKTDIPICQTCFGEMSINTVKSGAIVHPLCQEPKELFPKE
ncbi:ATP-binding protein [Arthrobacter psychrolactophilus]|uniref:ATP-binding protein n=1 Tax=Arthrobacter psychrolactophilus TaxID=92442 RepID=A0A2V5J7R9_9MICC|nr:ATP-binding protein [Arthrobacter psychrolactophilus]PYI38920.1 ATP-binding protein [Arthrobacter psychrolactophilus]